MRNQLKKHKIFLILFLLILLSLVSSCCLLHTDLVGGKYSHFYMSSNACPQQPHESNRLQPSLQDMLSIAQRCNIPMGQKKTLQGYTLTLFLSLVKYVPHSIIPLFGCIQASVE
jgi:hypothetical protein